MKRSTAGPPAAALTGTLGTKGVFHSMGMRSIQALLKVNSIFFDSLPYGNPADTNGQGGPGLIAIGSFQSMNELIFRLPT